MKTKHYVEFYYRGIFFGKVDTIEVKERKIESIEIPEGVHAYRFFDRDEMVVCGETLVGDTRNYSPKTYFGTVYNENEVREQFPELIFNMEYGPYKKVVQTIYGDLFPLKEDEGETVITI